MTDIFSSNNIFLEDVPCKCFEDLAGCHYHLNITGEGNTLHLNHFLGSGTIWVVMSGVNGCMLEIGTANTINSNLTIKFENGPNICTKESKVSIGSNNCFNGQASICAPFCSGNLIQIGNNNLFADGLVVWGGADHSIFDMNTHRRINHEMGVWIGSHIWFGVDCLLLNKARVPDDCIVGTRSIVNKPFEEKHTLIAGAPATVKRCAVTWTAELAERMETEVPEQEPHYLQKDHSGEKPLLTVEGVSISYKMGDFREIGLKEWIMRHFTHNYKVWAFKAVDNVSFKLYKGDLLGIIGSNGAGKSTLLKAVAQIMVPSEGAVEADGKISALLELGSGFDPDLTVKENTYLRGAMLGYTRKFMDEMYEDIIAYAELKKFEDRSFKQLSSGMQSRLAFAIASLVQPEILILDEVLSVGDGAFQQKSGKKMQEIIERGAVTILVSHSLDQIRKLCTKVLWLHKGRQIAFGEDVQGICDKYQRFLEGKDSL